MQSDYSYPSSPSSHSGRLIHSTAPRPCTVKIGTTRYSVTLVGTAAEASSTVSTSA